MMFKVGYGLNLQQIPKHLGLVRKFLHGHQALNLTEGHHPLDPVLWSSILEDSKLSVVLGASSWVVWIHEKLQLDPLRLVRIRPINHAHLLHLGNKRNGGVLVHRRRQSSGGFAKPYSWPLSELKFFNRSVITVLYVERTIAIHDLF
jgi:hypothetical protein